MATKPTTYTLRAHYPDMDAARGAVMTLERGGIPSSDIALEGEGAQEAATQQDQSATDEAFMHEASKSVLSGATIGSIAGASIGLLAGWLVLGGMGLYLGAVAGLFGGGGLGFLLGALVRVEESDSAQVTLAASADGAVTVAVYTDSREALDEAAAHLQDTGPTSVERLDADGNAVDQ